MKKYLKAFIEILINYHIYSIPVLIYEFYFYLKYQNQYNKFKYLKSKFLSDSIPCPFFFLKKIENILKKKNVRYICDLGSGYGKILYYFGKIKEYKIDGVELDKEIYQSSLNLKNKSINIYNKNILNFNLTNKNYDTYIINDPLKKVSDFTKLIKRIPKSKKKKIFFVLINLSKKKLFKMKKYFKIIDKTEISLKRNIFFCIKK